MLALFSQSRFRKLWMGATASGLATWALPFLFGIMLIGDTASSTLVGIILAARTIGFVLIMPFAGYLADVLSPITTVRVSGLVAAISSAFIAIDIAVNGNLHLLIPLAFVVGIGQGACRPAFQSLIAANVEAQDRQAANAANTISVRLVVMIGPALAAIGARFWGVPTIIAITAGLWLCVALSVTRVHEPDKAPSTASIFQGLIGGIVEARKHRWFMAGLGVLLVVIMLGYSATGVILPMVSSEVSGNDSLLTLGVTSYSIGGIVGAFLVSRWTPKAQGWWALAGLGAYSIAIASLVAVFHGAHPAILALGYALTGVGIEIFNVPWFTCIQREVPADKVARISSLDFLVSYGLAPLGLALIAPAATSFGITPVLVATAVACALAAAIAVFIPGTKDFSDPNPNRKS